MRIHSFMRSSRRKGGLRRSRVLCGVADSVFALHKDMIVQTHSNSSKKVWAEDNGLRYQIDELENGMPGVAPGMPESTNFERDLIADIKRMHDTDGMTFRKIAEELDVSKSEAHRLYKQWTPEIEEEITKYRDELSTKSRAPSRPRHLALHRRPDHIRL